MRLCFPAVFSASTLHELEHPAELELTLSVYAAERVRQDRDCLKFVFDLSHWFDFLNHNLWLHRGLDQRGLLHGRIRLWGFLEQFGLLRRPCYWITELAI